MTERKPLNKYHNPDPRCGYATSPDITDPLDYCWSYAHHIDGSDGYQNLEKICIGCEMWSGKREGGMTNKCTCREDNPIACNYCQTPPNKGMTSEVERIERLKRQVESHRACLGLILNKPLYLYEMAELAKEELAKKDF